MGNNKAIVTVRLPSSHNAAATSAPLLVTLLLMRSSEARCASMACTVLNVVLHIADMLTSSNRNLPGKKEEKHSIS
jgi:hypothetical protein